MIFVSDVHGADKALARLSRLNEPIVVLGDLVNLTDYRNGQGAIADVLGVDFAKKSALARAAGDYRGMRALWEQHAGAEVEALRQEIGVVLDSQYGQITKGLSGGSGYVIHGNVDRPMKLKDALPDSFEFVHGGVVEIENVRVGLVGGGIATPMSAEGEVSDEDMIRLLEGLGRVDVLGTHVPPDISALRRDVITGREERGSVPLRDYIVEYQPKYHFFGDVHQAQATQWRIGKTQCRNAGYFRASGRFLRLKNTTVETARIE